MITKKLAVVCEVDEPTPVAFLNLYEEGDIWIKRRGCEACSVARRSKCCGKCPCSMPDGSCQWHFLDKGKKPFYCIVQPNPIRHSSEGCMLAYECIVGSKKGKIRQTHDPIKVFKDTLD